MIDEITNEASAVRFIMSPVNGFCLSDFHGTSSWFLEPNDRENERKDWFREFMSEPPANLESEKDCWVKGCWSYLGGAAQRRRFHQIHTEQFSFPRLIVVPLSAACPGLPWVFLRLNRR